MSVKTVTRTRSKPVNAHCLTICGKRVVVLEEDEYRRLAIAADQWEPPMPAPNADGNYPALEALQVSIARSIIRQRRALGLTQAELANRAGVRLATLQRLEEAPSAPSVRAVDKIDRALARVEAARSKGQE